MTQTYAAYRRWRGHDGLAETMVVSDGFVWGAAMFGPIWAIAWGRWRTAAVLGVGWTLASGFAVLVGPLWSGLIWLLIAYWSGLTARGWESLWMHERDWRLIDVVVARGLDAAEARLIESDANRAEAAERRW